MREGKERGERERGIKMKNITTASRHQLYLILSYAIYVKDEKTVQLILNEVEKRNLLRRK